MKTCFHQQMVHLMMLRQESIERLHQSHVLVVQPKRFLQKFVWAQANNLEPSRRLDRLAPTYIDGASLSRRSLMVPRLGKNTKRVAQ